MKKIKKFILLSIILGGLFFLFGPELIPENLQPQEFLDIAVDNDVIIIFNSGGWGNTPLEKAEDFAPIIEGIQETLNEWGYSSIVIPYNRTKNTLLGKFTGAKGFLNSFDFPSEIMAEDLEFLVKNLPNKKIIITGLSNGAAFVNETYKKTSKEVKNSVYVITAGTPFWSKYFESDNILQLNNNGKDSLVEGNIKSLVLSLIKAPYRWISSKVNGQNLTLSQAFQISGHKYFWSSSEVNPQIITFLENKFH